MNGHRVRSALVVAAAAAAVAAGASASQAASPALIVLSANRAPSLSGEIYRVDPTGHRVDLSRSPASQDTYPLVSPDGNRVAFFSDRNGALSVYEVGIDGRGLVRVGGQSIGRPNGTGPLSWQPHGGRLAVSTDNGDWIVQRGRKPVRMRAFGITGWSPDGRVLAVSISDRNTKAGASERAVSPLGRTLWTVRNATQLGTSAIWSAHGLLAVPTGAVAARRPGIGVYDEAGRPRFKVRLGRLTPEQAIVGTWLTWSPDGSRLAFVSGRTFQVRTTTGRVLLRKRLRDDWAYLVWDGNRHVVGYGSCGCRVKSIDIRTGKVSPASVRFVRQTSTNGKLAILTSPSGAGFAIQVARTAGGPPKTYAPLPGCDQDGGWLADASSFKFVPGSRSLVYGSACWQPTGDLYSVPASGGAAHQITSSRSDHSVPALSPEGSEIAYSWNKCSPHGCRGGSYGIRVLNVDGDGERELTNTAECPPPSYGPIEQRASGDFAPAWSPGGATIVFSRLSCVAGPELYTVPASGGAVHDLGIVGSQPAWGPSRIAYTVGTGVWTANPDGTHPVQIDGGFSYSPAWSPDGRLAYLKGKRGYPDNYGNTLVVGSTRTTLPFETVSNLAWSPDGTRLVVTAQKTTTAPFDVYTVEPDGTDPIRLTTNFGASDASW